MTPEVFAEFADAIGHAIRSLESALSAHPEIAFPALGAIRESVAKHAVSSANGYHSEAEVTTRYAHEVLVGISQAIGKGPHQIDELFDRLLTGLERDCDGLARYVRDHALEVEPEFARAFNAAAVRHGFAPILAHFVRHQAVVPAVQPRPDAAKKPSKKNAEPEAEPQA